MIIIKKSNRFIALLLVALTCNVYSMKRLREEEKRSIPAGSRILLPTGRWVEIVGEILLDEAHIQDLKQFTDLPPEVLERIIYLLSANEAAQSLEEAAKNVSNLALVSKDLNALINHPSFCLHLIKHLSQKFHCSDEEVAEVLQTQEAKRRLALQKELYEICVMDTEPNIQDLEKCLLKGADINFTYEEYGSLLLEVYANQFQGKHVDTIRWLVTYGASEDQQNILLRWVIEVFYGDATIYNDQVEIIKILLNASADPEIIDNKGNSMLSLAQKTLDDWQKYYDEHKYGPYDLSEDLEDINKITTVIKMLEDAIKRKHGKK